MCDRCGFPFHGIRNSVQVHLVASPHNETPRPYARSFGPIPNRQKSALRCRSYTQGAGILTCFPFAALWLACSLGSPNPPLTSVAKETVCLRCTGFSPVLDITNTRIFSAIRSTRPLERASCHTARHLTYAFAYRGLGT